MVCFALAGAAADSSAADVFIETSPSENATVYRISSGDCSITWTAYGSELNRGVVKHASRCPDPLSSQLPLLTEVLSEFLARDAHAAAFRTLFWGGLVPEAGPSALEMPFRLALAASRSPGWNAKNGRPVKGDTNGFVKDLVNRQRLYPELTELFGRFRKSITLASVEKVRVMKAKDLPFYSRLKAEGVRASARLPFDCMAWFSVSDMEKEQEIRPIGSTSLGENALDQHEPIGSKTDTFRKPCVILRNRLCESHAGLGRTLPAVYFRQTPVDINGINDHTPF